MYLTNSVKYLGIKIVENLKWNQQISDLAIKLNRTNTILSPKILNQQENCQNNVSYNMQILFTLFLYCLGTKIKSNLKTLYFAKEIHTAYIFLGCTTQMSHLLKIPAF